MVGEDSKSANTFSPSMLNKVRSAVCGQTKKACNERTDSDCNNDKDPKNDEDDDKKKKRMEEE